MTSPENVEQIFKSLTDRFTQLSSQVEQLSDVIKEIGGEFSNSLAVISQQIEDLTKTLQGILKISDLQNIQTSITDILDNFQTELNVVNFKKLLADLDSTVKRLKQTPKTKE
ncbi:MAG: hypothetical protein ACTSQI_06360 [Candidatus Helarchaeota archaeon]